MIIINHLHIMNMITSYQSAKMCKMKSVQEMMAFVLTYQEAGIRQIGKIAFTIYSMI